MRRLMLAVAVVTALTATLMAAPANAAYVGGEGRLAFVRANQIYTVASTGGAVTQRTSAGKNYRPKWSPNGRRIAYIHETAGGARDVWVMRTNGTGKTRVTHLGNVTAAATWSPDGKTLAFGAGGDLGASLYRIRSTAPFGSPTLLLGYYTGCEGCDDESPSSQHAIDVDRFLAWSADGSTIAIFNHADAQLDDALYLYNVASGEAAQLLATGGSCCGFVEWSDLAWGTDGAFGYGEVNTGDFDGTDPYVKIVYPGFASAQGDKSPAPSPTNQHMAFTNGRSGTPKIYVSGIHGANRHVVVNNGYQPDWQPLP